MIQKISLTKQDVIKKRLENYEREIPVNSGNHVPHSSFYQEYEKNDGFINMLWRDKKQDITRYKNHLIGTFEAFNKEVAAA